jgi:GTP cyclohydrolase IA
MEQVRVESAIKLLIKGLGFQGTDFDDSPQRVARMWDQFFIPKPNMTTFEVKTPQGMICIKDHVCWGFCPHHLLPVKYTFKIGYIPQDRVLGLSKPARIAEWVLTSLPLQEDVPALVVDEINEVLTPKGAGCIVRGEHLCMQMRGVKSPCCYAISSNMSGCFLTEEATRLEFISL